MSGTFAQPAPLGHQAWIAARRAIVEAHAGGARMAALLGAPGMGKSALLAELERHFRASNHAAELIAHGDLLSGEETTHILLVDEADRLEEPALLALSRRPHGFVVLAALPAFAGRAEPLGAPLIRLGPLRPAEVPDYVAARVAALGLAPDRFGADALPVLAEASAGVPRLLNTLIGSSVFTADMEGDVRVAARHVAAAAALQAEVALPPPTLAPPSLEPAAAPEAAKPGLPEAVAPASPAATLAEAAPASVPPPGPPARRRGLPWLGAVAAAFLLLGGAAWLHQTGWPGAPATSAALAEGAEAVSPRPTEVLRQALSTAASPPVLSPTALLPAAPLPRVVLTYPRRDVAAAERSVALAAALAQAGWIVGSPFPVSRNNGGAALRYFFAEDREAALAVAALAGSEGGAPKLGSIPPGTPLPRPGTIELALAASPAMAVRAAIAPPEASSDPAPPVAVPVGPRDRVEPVGGAILLRWTVPGGATPGCCYLEVVSLPNPGEPAGPPREVFAGYGERPDSQALALAEPRTYAWRVITVSREGLRYATSPWTSFSLGRDGS